MSRIKQNGLTAGNSQPVKTLSYYATDFIARCASFARADAGLCMVVVVVLLQVVLLAAWRSI